MKILAICLSLFFLGQGIITAILIEGKHIKDTQANEILVVGTIILGVLGLISICFMN